MKKQDYQKNHHSRNDAMEGDLWTDELICACEYVQGQRKTVQEKSGAESLHNMLPKKHLGSGSMHMNQKVLILTVYLNLHP